MGNWEGWIVKRPQERKLAPTILEGLVTGAGQAVIMPRVR